MTKFITLKQITNEPAPFAERDDDTEGGEDDGLAPAAAQLRAPAEVEWKPNTVNVDAIRNYYPRKGGRVGCRVMMKTGVAYIVADEHDEITAKINA